MGKISTNFIAGRMNKVVDQRVLPEGEYSDAMNVRMGSTEKSELGAIENTKGNIALTALYGPGNVQLSADARCIGAIEDSSHENIFWFVHDENFPSAIGICDLIVSYNVLTNILTYHVVSINDGGNVKSTLNFSNKYVITGVNIIKDLLFFTDDYNAPRFININRGYPLPVNGVDGGGLTPLPNGIIPQQVFEESLLVIKKPPTESPTVEPISRDGQENFMEERFLSFAYRYKYIDGEYSATSQWSQVAFIPNPFEFSIESMLNEGMINSCNTAIITYNTGGPLVVGIDLLFKQSANNIIKIIEKLDKKNLGIPDNQDAQYIFDNSKIFTIISESELLRLYDNVPRFAKAQTIMGNRLMYGNYVEGYDLIDRDETPIKLEYFTNLISLPIGSESIPDRQEVGYWTINGPTSVSDGRTFIDLTGIPLVAGSSITVNFTVEHALWQGITPYPTQTTAPIDISFVFYLGQNYSSVYQLAISPEFQQAIGTSLPLGNIKPVFSFTPGVDTSCDGTTLTDDFNCLIPTNIGLLTKYASGQNAYGESIMIITSPGSNEIGFQFPAMGFYYVQLSPPMAVYKNTEYYTITATDAYYKRIANSKSLHSNRGYEIGIVYMDEFNRASTALVSPNNTQYVPCAYSSRKNSIQVTIPATQVAPYWAKRYKFVIKPDAEFYETIYCKFFFTDPYTGELWILLEGESSRKVEQGDRLIVKADTSGPVQNCAYATVLEKSSKSSAFITPTSGAVVPAGTYMKMNPNSFNSAQDANSTVAPGLISMFAGIGGNYIHLRYPMNLPDPSNPGSFIDYSVPAGSRIVLDWHFERGGTGSKCERRGYVYNREFIASRNYDNMEDWFNGDNVASTLSSGTSLDNGSTSLQYIPTNGFLTATNFNICYIQFYRDLSNNQLLIQFSSGKSCIGGNDDGRRYFMNVEITVFRALDVLIFETEPSDAAPDVFFENNLSFNIDEYGNHYGNLQDQNISAGDPAIVDTEFFNCFSFGNGAESYKIRDSIIGRPFVIGERVTAVSSQDYKEADRFADITYSGIYNTESNLNKLNEFNLGLLNYKYLESSFGPIFILDGRETDVLTLQEDKISYVLAGKNLLSDSAAGGAISSVPEVLGTQIARVEKYGISFNPESYVQWGYDRFFTDVKRGVVVNIKGDSMQQDGLKIISEANMRTWFRDEFNSSFTTQKLGGYDPYMNEYVLSTNDRLIPNPSQCLDCGVSQTLNLANASQDSQYFEYCVNLGSLIGDTTMTWTVVSSTGVGNFEFEIDYAGATFSIGPTTTSGSYTFNKNDINEQIAVIRVYYTDIQLILDIKMSCPDAESLTIIEVVVTNNVEAGDTSHIQYRYTNGAFIGPLISSGVVFASSMLAPVVSRYNLTVGFVGSGSFPPQGSTMTLISNSIVPDNFVFDPTNDKFRYLRTNTFYSNTPTDISNLLAASSIATPNTGGGSLYQAQFTVPLSSLGNYLYLIWDYRDALPLDLCYASYEDPNPITDICCNCDACQDACISFTLTNNSLVNTAEIYFPYGADNCGGAVGPFSVFLNPEETYQLCVNNVAGVTLYQIIDGDVTVGSTCGCGCTDPCSQWFYVNKGDLSNDVHYIACSTEGGCDGSTTTVSVTPHTVLKVDACAGTTPTVTGTTEGGLLKTIDCGLCNPFTDCITFNVFAPGTKGTTVINYINCSNTLVSVSLDSRTDPFQICCLYPNAPYFTTSGPSGWDFEITSNGCNCTLP
jgi:hypothetical protein